MDKLNIEFRSIKEADLETIMQWRMQPNITQYMNTDPKLTLNDQYKWYHNIMKKKNDYYWIILLDDIKIGVASLINADIANKKIYTGVYIAVHEKRSLRLILDIQWNLYEYAFEYLHYNKVCEEVFSINKSVLRILDMCGSKCEGELRNHILKNGIYYNVTIRGILKNEWFALKPNITYNKINIEDYK